MAPVFQARVFHARQAIMLLQQATMCVWLVLQEHTAIHMAQAHLLLALYILLQRQVLLVWELALA